MTTRPDPATCEMRGTFVRIGKQWYIFGGEDWQTCDEPTMEAWMESLAEVRESLTSAQVRERQLVECLRELVAAMEIMAGYVAHDAEAQRHIRRAHAILADYDAP